MHAARERSRTADFARSPRPIFVGRQLWRAREIRTAHEAFLRPHRESRGRESAFKHMAVSIIQAEAGCTR